MEANPPKQASAADVIELVGDVLDEAIPNSSEKFAKEQQARRENALKNALHKAMSDALASGMTETEALETGLDVASEWNMRAEELASEDDDPDEDDDEFQDEEEDE